MQIAQCRAQLAARRVSQGASEAANGGGSAPSVPPPPVPVAPKPVVATSKQVSVGTSMSGTLLRAEEAAAAAAARRTEPRHAAAAAGGAADEQLLSALMGQSARQEACLTERLASLRLLVSYWEAGDVKKMLQHLQRIDDPSVAVDIVNAGVLTGGRLDLECALVVLPLLDSLLGSTYEEHTLAALQAVSQVVASFGPLIRNTRALARDTLGVDLSAEARQQRCQACFEQLAAMVPRLRQLAAGKGKAKYAAKSLLVELRSGAGLAC